MVIYFNEAEHKYTDEYDNIYTSVTTYLQKYQEEFDKDFWLMAKAIELLIRRDYGNGYFNSIKRDCEGKYELIVKNYKNRINSIELIDAMAFINKEWDKKTKTSLDRGNKRHKFFEASLKYTTNFKSKEDNKILFTISDIENYQSNVDSETFKSLKLKNIYPKIYTTIKNKVEAGYSLYPELGVFNFKYKICGTIDLPFIKKNKIIIGDYKTNEDILHDTAGYYKKRNGIKTDEWIITDDRLKKPLQHLVKSKLNIYNLQLSFYAYLCELHGYECEGLELYHIGKVDDTDIETIYTLPYLKEEIKSILR